MEIFDRKKHWENIYQSKEQKDFSWYQSVPITSIDFLKKSDIAKTASIIDIGGGDSLFVDYLLDSGYQDITVLDISKIAIDKAKHRLKDKSSKVKWILADVVKLKPTKKYDFRHDRATFHFLTQEEEIESYIEIAGQSLKPSGILVIGTFSEQGPKKCSGIEIKQYSETTITDRFKEYFEKIKCITVDHTTPFNTIQNFIFCCFRRLQS